MLQRIRIALGILGILGGGAAVTHQFRDNDHPSDHELVLQLSAKYAPVLFLSPFDYQPKEVAILAPGKPSCSTVLRLDGAQAPIATCPSVGTIGSEATHFLTTHPNEVADSLFIDITAASVGQKEKYRLAYGAIEADYAPVTYARVGESGDQGKWNEVWIEYWFFYYYDDFFLLDHEGDWEHIQVRIPATSIRAALRVDPKDVQYSQHVCDRTERMLPTTWDKVEKRGVRPVVYVAQGSHANYPDNGWLGVHADFPCVAYDRTFSPPLAVTMNPTPVAISCTSHDSEFSWLEFRGYWGEGRSALGPCR